jgi:hypothetical protein
MADEESHGFGRGVLGRHDQVAFVLSVLVIYNDDDLPGCDRCDRICDWCRGHGQDLSVEPSSL